MSKTYRASHYRHIHQAEDTHFWFVGRNEMISSLVRQTLPRPSGMTFLDIGCGTGVTMGMLEGAGYSVTGLDVNARALSYARRKTRGPLIRSSIFGFKPQGRFAAAGAFDVMEHISDDEGFLRRCREVLAPRGFLFLTVPAGTYLWSSVDAESGHQRRYVPADLRRKLTDAGFHVISMKYWNSLLLPLYMAWRFVEGRRGDDLIERYLATPHPLINRLLLGILRADTAAGRWGMPFGATLVVAAQKL